MKKNSEKIPYMPNKVMTIVLLLIPIVGVLVKNLFYLGYLLGDNYYEMNVANAFVDGGKYIFTQLAVIALLLIPTIFFKGKGKFWYLLGADLFFTILVLIDLCYVRFFNDLPSISMVKIISFDNDSTATSGNAMLPILAKDVIFFLDFLVWIGAFLTVFFLDRKKNFPNKNREKYRIIWRSVICAGVVVISAISLCILPIVGAINPDNEIYAYSYGTHEGRKKSLAFTPLGYHMYDIGESISYKVVTDKKQALIDGYYEWNSADYVINDYFGIYSNKNVIALQLESIETFVIGNSVEGQELTPNLNRLLSKSMFFTNIYDQVACGNSSDCDFLLNASMFPSSGVSAYNFFSDNTFNSTPVVLGESGYVTSYYNSLKNSFWNYFPMNENGMKYQINDSDFVKDDMLYQYLSDESYLSQLADKVISLQASSDSPVYSHTTTDSSHGPFVLPAERCYLNLSEKYDNKLGEYFQAVRYADHALGLFLEKMATSAEYNDTIFVFVGDHRGIHKYYPQAINAMPEEDVPDFVGKNFDAGVPFIIFDPSAEGGERIDTYGGQVDVTPTLLYLLGIDYDLYKDSHMGRSLVATSRNCTLSSDGILRGEYSAEDKYWLNKAYYLSDLMLETDYFAEKK